LSAPYVADAVASYLLDLQQRDAIASRPIRVDGLTRDEIGSAIELIQARGWRGRLSILASTNNEATFLVNAERATRYRNQVDAPTDGEPFVLFVPQGQVVESSLDEPAFFVVPRAAVFRKALGALRVELGLSYADVESIREVAVFKQAESLYAFLRAWDSTAGAVEAWASYEHLGLLGDSKLDGLDVTSLRGRLVPNAKATELLLKPGQSPNRVLEDLANNVGLDLDTGATPILRLVDWLRSGRLGERPAALDFATWPVRVFGDPILRWNPVLSQPPHRGWAEQDGRTYVQDPAGTASLEWSSLRSDAETAFEVHLVEDTTQQTVRKVGRTRRPKRAIRWTTVVSDAVRAELRELNPTGDVEGYALRLKVDVYQGKRWVTELISDPFFVNLPDAAEFVSAGAAPSAYHALYRYHTEQKSAKPSLAARPEGEEAGPRRVRLSTADGRSREATMDLSAAMLGAEAFVLAHPRDIGPIEMRLADGLWTYRRMPIPDLGPEALKFLDAREELFSALGSDPVEAVDLLEESFQSLASRYADAYLSLVGALEVRVAAKGGLAAADQLVFATLTTSDAVTVEVELDSGPVVVVLLSPTSPVSVAWLLEFGRLVHEWLHGRFDPLSKPSYRGRVEDFAVGPRSMVVGVSGPSEPAWFAYAGNLTNTWPCYIPVSGRIGLRAQDWESALVAKLGLSPRRIGGGRLDAARIGSRLKKYAALHPYVAELRVGAVLAGDGTELLDALKVIDEQGNTPRGARSIRDLRYQLTLIGPETPRLGQAIDDLTNNPGQDKWRRHASAILDNPETVLSPGFAYARRPIKDQPDGHDSIWPSLLRELDSLVEHGLHVLLLGPMLQTSVGSITAPDDLPSLETRGLLIRPRVRHVAALQDTPYEGDWMLTVATPLAHRTNQLERATGALADAVRLALGHADQREVGLRVALSGVMSTCLERAHEVADWVVIADPLFSVELMDRSRTAATAALLLDFTPEFEPYPGGRVVVTTNSLAEMDALADAVGTSFGRNGPFTRVLSSISARLLLSLSNPTKQVVHGLTGLALTRALIEERHPGALVLPIDGHEDMFALPKKGRSGQLADLLAITTHDGLIQFHVFESKWTGAANLKAQSDSGAKQALTTAEVLEAEYIEYRGVDRALRLEALRDVVAFHAARAHRHDVGSDLTEAGVWQIFGSDSAVNSATIDASVIVWCPDSSLSVADAIDEDGVARVIVTGSSIDRFAEATYHRWHEPGRPDTRTEALEIIRDAAAETRAEALPTEVLRDAPLTNTYPPEDGDASAPPPADWREKSVGAHGGLPPSRAPAQSTSVEPVAHPATANEVDTVRAAASTPAPEERVSGTAIPAIDPTGSSGDVTVIRDSDAVSAPRGCVTLGELIGVTRRAIWCPPALSNGHLILVGGSGAGKTTALRHIAAELRDANLHVLVLDFHGDLLDPENRENVFAFDYEGNDNFVNPFHLDASYGSRLTPSRLKWEFLEAFRSHYPSMGVHQINFVAELIEEAFAARGITDSPTTWSNSVSFAHVLERFEVSDAPENAKAKIRSYMKRFSEWRIFHGGEGIAVESFLERSTRLDLSQLDETARNILADVVLRRLFMLVRALGPVDAAATGWQKFRAFVVIDEAQLLMGGVADAKASLAKYAAEARKFGIGLILATQLRDNVPSDIWGNIDTRLFMQALDPLERMRNAKAANVPEEALRSLARGQAILTSSSQPSQRPATIQITPRWL